MLIAARSPASSARARGPGEFGAASPDKVALILDSLIIGFSVNATLKDSEVSPASMHDTLLDVAGRLLSVDFD